MTKILAPLSAQIVAHDATRVLDGDTREDILVDVMREKDVSRAYEVKGGVAHEMFVEVKEGASCVMNLLFRAYEKDAKTRVHISVLLQKNAKISLDVASFCENVASESDVRVFVVFNEGSRATVRVFTRVSVARSVVHEEIRGLTLGETSNASFIPELSLFHDDIVATHATSVTKIDEKYVAYLQSRGVLREDAVKEIAKAFLYGNLS